MDTDLKKSIVIYTDGACKGNPGPGGWGLILVSPDGQIRERGQHVPDTTNNRMEMQAVLEGLRLAKGQSAPVVILTDSSYLINGMTRWVHGWVRNNWITSAGQPVLNQDLWKQLTETAQKMDLRYIHVRGHAGIAGNERADTIASSFAEGVAPTPLFEGLLSDYPFNPYEYKPAGGHKTPQSSSTRERNQVYYISLVNGTFRRHDSWPACQKATSGFSGARFRKVKNAGEEHQIRAEWGCPESSNS
ncbi:MAG: ribonuclease HI [Deltaproteobacteria bacterium]|nr:ribonuclease HI [Deltaproteobacteria bacterium]